MNALVSLFAQPALAAGLLMLVPASLLSAHRAQAAMLVLALLLGGGFVAIFWLDGALTFGLLLVTLAAVLVAAPLLERGRFLGLLAAGIGGAAAGVYILERLVGWWLPPIASLALLPLVVVMALTVGLLGGMHLPLHPRRVLATGAAVWHPVLQGLALAGWALLLAGLAGGAWEMNRAALGMAQLAAVLAGGFVALLQAHQAGSGDGLQKAGEGMVAGLLISLLVPLTPMAGAALGLVAALCVGRGEALALALRLADPHHFIGALLMPAFIGLLMPGIADMGAMAPAVSWLGAALATGVLVAMLLWPLTMISVGVALPARLVREGVHR